uniref:Ig-like domain-containing protein n=1 Tax=Pelusios castaneus TaxID=367368 RepID=A0A8C8SNK7_9SAUR
MASIPWTLKLKELTGIEGGTVTFFLGIPAEQYESVAWTVNQTRSLVNVGTGTTPTILDKSYEERLRVPARNDSLQLSNLRMEDTGTYSAQITFTKGTMHRQFTLRMYRKWVPAPTIACDSVTCGNETCDYSLTCTVRGGENVTYQWTHPAGDAVVSTGPILQISQRPPADPLTITCTAQNPVSDSSTTSSAKEICPGKSSAHTGRAGTGSLSLHPPQTFNPRQYLVPISPLLWQSQWAKSLSHRDSLKGSNQPLLPPA